MTRRLAAILAADIVGYSALMREDEESVLQGIKTLRRTVVDPAIEARTGRIVKLMGDGMLVEFPAALEAVRAAMEIQQAMADEPSAGITFRIGINLGDVVVEDDDIFGDGVNIAARLEAESQPGGICISDMVHEQIRGRLKEHFADCGELELKNIDRPVRAWEWVPLRAEVSDRTATAPDKYGSEPERPTVAVLPFDVLDSDPDTGFLADGMVEDIITMLAKVPELSITARNSTFVYKGKAVDVRKIGRELGVGHVLEGSVRRIGARIRVTAQLNDVATGAHEWAETFDGTMDDAFAFSDGIARKILGALDVRLGMGEMAEDYLRGNWSTRAYELFSEALAFFWRFSRRDSAVALRRALQAAEDSPDWAPPRALAGWIHLDGARWGWSADRKASIAAGLEAVEAAISRDPQSVLALSALGYGRMLEGEFDQALELAGKWVALAPSDGSGMHSAAMVANYCGRPDMGLSYARHARQVMPVAHSNILTELGHAHILAGESMRALQPLRHALAISPLWISSRCLLIGALDKTGDADGARTEATALMQQAPRFRLSRWGPTQPYRDLGVLEAQMETLRRAGVPD